MSPTIFGYSETKAAETHTSLEMTMARFEFLGRQFKQSVPDTGAIATRVDDALEILREVAGDLHGVVDERTERES